MSEANGRLLEERVLVLAPTPKDAARSRAVLAEVGVASVVCADMAALCREVESGAGAAVVTEEALADDGEQCLGEALRAQPAWSELPILVLTRGGADSPVALRALETLGNVTLLERPVRMTALVSAVRAALRARRRQYQVRDHLAERESTAEELREEGRRKDEFLAMLGHELRNPLAPIRNCLAVLRLRGDGDPDMGQMTALMERQVRHMVRLVDDLLDVARITRGKIDLRKEAVELAAVASRAVEGVRSLLDERRLRLDMALPDGPLWLEADPARLEQVLANLLTNAAKYTEPGGHIALSIGEEGHEAVVRVKDSGIGIRPEMLPRIFDLFQQADRLPGRVSEGLGLGLTLVKRLSEMHGGSAEAHSDGPGKGSEFVVRLPRPSLPAPPWEGAATAELSPEGRSLRVLVVDDNIDSAQSLARLLREHRHHAAVAHDGPSALAMVPQFRPEVVLLDIGLPGGMDGYQVLRRLRRDFGLQDAWVAAVTGFGQEEDRRRAREAGFDAHLTKPVDPEALQRMLEQWVTAGDKVGSGGP